MIGRMYNAFDKMVLKGVNKGVKAWNWTTGKTKAELANGLDTGYGICVSVGLYELSPINIILFPITLYACHSHQKTNTMVEKLERDALKKGCLDVKVESSKYLHKIMGNISALSGAFLISSNQMVGNTDKDFVRYLGQFTMAGGLFMQTACCYVMRTDYLPPGKNCIQRGREKLAEIIEAYRPQPRTAMAPIIEEREWQRYGK